MNETMDDAAFDAAMITAAFDLAATRGWRRMSVGEAARTAGLDLARARARFPGRGAILMRFGLLADQGALGALEDDIDPRERLFDIVMRRFDALQRHRSGVLALLDTLPFDPGLGLLLYGATLRSMAWLLAGAGISNTGLSGALRVHGLLAVWMVGLRAWRMDDNQELSGTMAAVDKALNRAVEAEQWLPGRTPPAEAAAAAFDAMPPDPAPDVEPSDDPVR